ncbi:MAG: hypothetical protein ABIN80_21580 [Dyadobacter sp.]|uniref:hypothetical protein n=1 Tax=Dyadobacter sp. TaxID=1914288 RepID=UPI00326733DB
MTKNVLNVAPLLADHFVDIEIDANAFEENEKLVTENAHRLGFYATGRYLSDQSLRYDLYEEYEQQIFTQD